MFKIYRLTRLKAQIKSGRFFLDDVDGDGDRDGNGDGDGDGDGERLFPDDP